MSWKVWQVPHWDKRHISALPEQLGALDEEPHLREAVVIPTIATDKDGTEHPVVVHSRVISVSAGVVFVAVLS